VIRFGRVNPSQKLEVIHFGTVDPSQKLDVIGFGPVFVLRDCSFWKLKGLRFTGLAQKNEADASSIFTLLLMDSHDCLIESVEVDHMGGYGP